MTTPEGRVKDKVKAVLKEFGSDVYSHWPVQTGYGEPTLDCTGSVKSKVLKVGVAFAIETKAPFMTMTPRQMSTARDMYSGGMKIFLIGAKPGMLDVELEKLRTWLRSHVSP